MAKESKSNIKNEFNVAQTGLNLDNSQNNIKKGALSYALNAALENYDANSVQYQNEPGNEFCFDFPDGYKQIGNHFIPEQNKIIFFLANPDTGGSEIGYMENNDCVYRTIVNADCLSFDINHPVLRMVHKVTNFGTELYWADNNGRRFLDLDNIPYIPLQTSDVCDPEDSSVLDCNKLLLQPEISIPFIGISNVISGGDITSGTYQFTVQYADAVGNPYTSYYGVTNPTPIADINLATVNFNYMVGKSIVIDIFNLNPSGQYQYFNLAVIKTINDISTPELVGTYFIDEPFKQITYTGQIKTNIQLSINDIFEKFTYYDNADYVTAVQDVLVWKGVTAVERINYQIIANEIKLQWQSYRIPSTENYANEANAANYRGYLRDEVYAFEIVFMLKNGKETDGFHIPGRDKNTSEVVATPIDVNNPDFIGTPDEGTTSTAYWKVYNTAVVEATHADYDPTDDNYKGPYQNGQFAYWESSEEYPCDEDVWGTLAGLNIRHHKFPDVLISPVIESSSYGGGELVVEDVAIFPIGVKIESADIINLIGRSDLTDDQKDDIIGYKIVRADRGVNKSILAKGMLRNVGKYEKDDQTFLYPNYPYNDLKEDKFLLSVNNAWIAECEEYVIEIFNLPEQDDVKEGTNNYVTVEYRSCDNNKTNYKTFYEVGLHYVCSIVKPRFDTRGIYNEMNHGSLGSTPTSDCDAITYPAHYDEYYVFWSVTTGSGFPLKWEDIVTGDTREWSNNGDTFRIKVLVGTEPYCDGDDQKCRNQFRNKKLDFELTNEERPESDCQDDIPLTIENNEEVSNRQIFNSPETSFGQPFLGSILKLESVMYGGGKAHFVEVKDNAKYKLLTKEAQEDALLAAEKVADLTQAFSLEAMFSVYQSYTTTYINGITRKNYGYSFNSTASYNYSAPIPNDFGIKQRNLDIKRYITPDVLSVGEEDGVIVNNYNRETSVYLRTEVKAFNLPYPHESQEMATTGVSDDSRFTISDKQNCSKPEKEENISVVSYYGSLKNEFINQYGQIYSYDSIDTGFVKIFDNLGISEDTIFGGDTFIGRFAYKTKVPFFFDNRVNSPNDSDIFYDEIGNIAFPRYWHSSRSILETYQGEKSPLTLTNFISYKAHNFDCPNSQELIPADADPDTNPDRTYYDGYFYMFAYGVPSFYCESSYNVDLRTAFNNKEGEFWPHVSTGIPDEWFQETNVSILNDNTYNYNVTFSKQNKESVITHIPADWGTGEDRVKYPFRAVYSDKQVTDADNRVNNWLTYRPISYFDFPQNYGELTALDGLKNSSILARFENKSLLYNSLLTIDTTNPQAAYIGNANLFRGAPPIDFGETDQGYAGSQHKFLLKTPYGALYVDAKRGQVFLLNGTQLQDLSVFGSGMHRWFTAHLPFEIIKYFPITKEDEDDTNDINIDNNFNGIGLHGVFDSNYERAIITKIDYIPLSNAIVFRDEKYYVTENDLEKEVYLIDSDYFCNVSWTISFNFNTNSWISFHSYIPNWYVGENNFYYSGLNHCPNDFDALVGVLDPTIPTTTTTTTIPLTTTTSTTIVVIEPDCDFDAVAEVPLCDIIGVGIFVGSPDGPVCERPTDLEKNVKLFTQYTLVSPVADIDSTVSSELACSNLSYYTILGESDTNYSPISITAAITGYNVGDTFYDHNTAPDCTYIANGWYFTDETSTDNLVFEIVDGEIAQIVDCGIAPPTSTTTTTTTLASFSACYSGIYLSDDPLYPLGGVLQYFDEFGIGQTIASIFVGDTVNITYSSIIAAQGVIACSLTTTTTTTV